MACKCGTASWRLILTVAVRVSRLPWMHREDALIPGALHVGLRAPHESDALSVEAPNFLFSSGVRPLREKKCRGLTPLEKKKKKEKTKKKKKKKVFDPTV